MTVTIEILKKEALALLRNLEQLKLLQFVPAKSKASQKGKVNAQKSEQPEAPLTQAAMSNDAIKPLRENITLDELLKEQNFKGFDREGMDKLIAKIDVQEPLEELLAMLKP